jgi:two-component system KDP operon response regulator KdpE
MQEGVRSALSRCSDAEEQISMARGLSVLIIDEDPAVRRLLRRGLRAAGYRVQDIEPASGALGCIAKYQFDLLILDIDVPAGGGTEAIRMARACSSAPILALSCRGGEDATVDALDSGADDYIHKPFGTKELLARVGSALRRRAREQGKSAHLVTGGLEIDLLGRRVRSGGHDVHLPVKLYAVLRELAEKAGKILTHEELLRAVWGEQCVHRVQYLRVAIRELRRKLEDDPTHPRYITTETGIGYRLEVQKRTEHRDVFSVLPASGRKM